MRTMRLQMFPLNTVLYPYCILPLHIFERRYRTMIKMCLEYDRPFGIAQIRVGTEVGGRSQTAEVGTVAKVTNVIEFADGRMFIAVQGDKRFKILSSAYDEDVMTAHVELYEDEAEQTKGRDLGDLPGTVRKLFEKYWKLSALALNKDLGRIDLPDDPNVLSWLVPSVLHIQPELKQAVLLKRTTEARLELEQEILIEEIENLLDVMREGREF